MGPQELTSLDATISASNEVATPGSDVTDTISLNNPNLIPMEGLDLELNYDVSKLTNPRLDFSKGMLNAWMSGLNLSIPGKIRIASTTTSSAITSSGELLRVTFSVPSSLGPGSFSPITFTKAQINEQTIQHIENGEIRVPDPTPPTRPIITDDGDITGNNKGLHAVITSQDPESGISEYQYAVSDTSGEPTIVPWTSNGNNPEVTIQNLNLAHAMTYYIWAKAKNASGLWSEPYYSNGIKIDIRAPVFRDLLINLGASYTTSAQVSLYAAAQDDNPGTIKVSFSNDKINWSVPENSPVSSRPWTLSSGDGAKYVYVKFMDSAGNWSNPVSRSIILDTTLPKGAVMINNNKSTTTSTLVTLNLSAYDQTSGMKQFKISNDKINWSSPRSYFPSTTWSLTPGLGLKSVYVQYQDKAGNWSQITQDTIYLIKDIYTIQSTRQAWVDNGNVAV